MLLLAVLFGAFSTTASQVGLVSSRKNRISDAQKRVEELFKKAQIDVADGDYKRAAEEYERALRLQPNSAEALSNLGVAYHMLGRVPEAVNTLQGALSLNPDLIPANLLLGIDLVSLSRPDKAIAPLQRVLEHDPHNRDALLALASADFALHRFDQAAEIYQREVSLQPADVDAWYGLGLSFEHVAENTARRLSRVGKDSAYYQRLLGEFLTDQSLGVEAEEAFQRALSLAGEDNEGLHAALGFLYLRLGDVYRADQEFGAEFRLHPGNPDPKLGVAASAIERKESMAALKNLCDVYQTDPGFFRARLSFLASVLSEGGQAWVLEKLSTTEVPAGCSEAAKLLREELTSPESFPGFEGAFEAFGPGATQAVPGNAHSSQATVEVNQSDPFAECVNGVERAASSSPMNEIPMARCAWLSGRFRAAFSFARAATAKEPDSVVANYWLAEAARRLAGAAFQKAVVLNPNAWQGHILLGDIYRQRKNWDLAVSHYQAAAQLKPTSPAPFLGLATLYWETGRFDRAEPQLQKALSLDPDGAQANFELGDIYAHRHLFEEAVPYLRKTIARNPDLLAAHADLGKSYAVLGETQPAIAELSRASPMDRTGEIYYQLYVLYRKEGQTALAQQALAKSESLRTLELQTRKHRFERAAERLDQGPNR